MICLSTGLNTYKSLVPYWQWNVLNLKSIVRLERGAILVWIKCYLRYRHIQVAIKCWAFLSLLMKKSALWSAQRLSPLVNDNAQLLLKATFQMFKMRMLQRNLPWFCLVRSRVWLGSDPCLIRFCFLPSWGPILIQSLNRTCYLSTHSVPLAIHAYTKFAVTPSPNLFFNSAK